MKSLSHQKDFYPSENCYKSRIFQTKIYFMMKQKKPNLKDGKLISISHSFEFSALIISDKVAGIDLEMQREKIITIAEKFMDTRIWLSP